MGDMMTRCQVWLGTFVEVTTHRDDAIEAAFGAIATVHALMNRHDRASEVSAINGLAIGEAITVHDWTAQVLARALFWSRMSDGAFDPTLTGDWRCVDLSGRDVRLRRPVTIDLGGIAKGFAVDCAIAAMQAAGATAGLVNAGGDMRGYGPSPWSAVLVDPTTRIAVATASIDNCALATSAVRPSGDFSHLPARRAGTTSATVQCPHAIDADALTKIVLSGSARTQECLATAKACALTIDAGGRISGVLPLDRAA